MTATVAVTIYASLYGLLFLVGYLLGRGRRRKSRGPANPPPKGTSMTESPAGNPTDPRHDHLHKHVHLDIPVPARTDRDHVQRLSTWSTIAIAAVTGTVFAAVVYDLVSPGAAIPVVGGLFTAIGAGVILLSKRSWRNMARNHRAAATAWELAERPDIAALFLLAAQDAHRNAWPFHDRIH